MDLFALGLKIRSDGMSEAKKNLSGIDAEGKKVAARFSAIKASIIGAAIVGFGAKLIRETIDAQNEQAQLAAVLKSTGGAAGVTMQQLDGLASQLQDVSTFSDGAVKGAQALLLTFTQIRGAQFEGATRAVVDLATAMGTDLKSAAIQVGKALNDPITGVSALQRVGVSFSESQKEVIKKLVETGQAARAQQVILAELDTQFGGSAEAARNTLGGALTHLGNKWDELFDVAGESTKGIVGAINAMADSLPEIKSKFESFFSALINGFKGLKVGYLRDAKDIQNVLARSNELSGAVASKLPGALGRAGEKMLADARGQRKAMADIQKSIDRTLAGMGPDFSDVTNESTTDFSDVNARKPPPRAGTGTGKGKQKDISLPSFDINWDSVERDRLERNTSFEKEADLPYQSPIPAWLTAQAEATLKAIEDREKRIREALEDEAQRIADFSRTIVDGLAQTLGDAVYNAFSAAFNGEGLGGVFAAFGKTVLGGLGSIFVQMGQKMVAGAALMQAFQKALIKFVPGGAIVAGLALIALGATMNAMAASGNGAGRAAAGGSYSSGGAGRIGQGTTDITRFRFVDSGTGKMLNEMNPRQSIINNVTIIGEKDPRASAALQRMMDNHGRRKG